MITMTDNRMALRILVVAALVLTVFLTPSTVSAQQQMIELRISHTPVTELTVGDIDFKTLGSRSLFFTLSVQSTVQRSVRIIGDLDIVLADGSLFTPAATLKTKPFNIPASPDRKVISNVDISPSSPIKVDNFDFSKDAKDRIQDLALSTGKLPSGTYTFTIHIEDANDPNISSNVEQIVLNLQTISRLDLISPLDMSEMPNPLPQFNWLYDGSRVELSIYEFLPSKRTKEEAAEGNPHLVVRSGDPDLPLGTHTFQYPANTVRSLEPGKKYVWRVKGLTVGSGGSGSSINSDVWQFSVASTGGNGAGGGELNNVSNQILNLTLTVQILNDLLSGDLILTGVMYIDGKPVSADEVARLLRDLVSNPDKIITVQIVN